MSLEGSSATNLTLASALLKAQAKMGSAIKDASNPFYKSKYADFNSVLKACKTELNDNGIVILQPVSVENGLTVVTTTLLHSSGQQVSSSMPIPSNQDMQKLGSAISYARRYTLQSLISLPSSEDDDGEGSVGRNSSALAKGSSVAAKTEEVAKPTQRFERKKAIDILTGDGSTNGAAKSTATGTGAKSRGDDDL